MYDRKLQDEIAQYLEEERMKSKLKKWLEMEINYFKGVDVEVRLGALDYETIEFVWPNINKEFDEVRTMVATMVKCGLIKNDYAKKLLVEINDTYFAIRHVYSNATRRARGLKEVKIDVK